VINEATASTFILRRDRERGWLTALVWFPVKSSVLKF